MGYTPDLDTGGGGGVQSPYIMGPTSVGSILVEYIFGMLFGVGGLLLLFMSWKYNRFVTVIVLIMYDDDDDDDFDDDEEEEEEA